MKTKTILAAALVGVVGFVSTAARAAELPYAIGAIAMFWVIQRTLSFLVF